VRNKKPTLFHIAVHNTIEHTIIIVLTNIGDAYIRFVLGFVFILATTTGLILAIVFIWLPSL